MRAPALEPARAARIDQLLQRYADENRIAGAVALVLRDGKPVYERAVSLKTAENGSRTWYFMTEGTIELYRKPCNPVKLLFALYRGVV